MHPLSAVLVVVSLLMAITVGSGTLSAQDGAAEQRARAAEARAKAAEKRAADAERRLVRERAVRTRTRQEARDAAADRETSDRLDQSTRRQQIDLMIQNHR